jgi:GNAT superfamily N-acetyltransferase
MAITPIDCKYIGDLEEIDEEAYGPGVYDWWHPFEHVTVMMYNRAQGFISYRLHKDNIEVEKLAVRKDMRRKGIGVDMVWWLIRRAQHRRINTIRLTIPETNVVGSQFLAACGFTSQLEGKMISFKREVING